MTGLLAIGCEYVKIFAHYSQQVTNISAVIANAAKRRVAISEI